ncbi:GNAT family N-acetyltransferase [Pseudomonadota bacterium AL_CKDN230030165-1A_HGKHYDSX7]
MTDIQHDLARQRFETHVDGHACELDYQVRNQVMAILHTGVPPAVGGRGIAAQLTQTALDYARSQGLHVQPLCSYAAAYIRRHPQYADLVR